MNQISTPGQGQVARTDNRSRPPSATLRPHLGARIEMANMHGEISKFRNSLEDIGHSQPARDAARQASERLPSDAELHRLLDTICEAGPATRAEIGTITGAMCDSIQTFDAARSPGCLDALLLVLEFENQVEPFTAQALADAAFKILRTDKYLPVPDAVVSEVRRSAKSYRTKANIIHDVLAGREKLRLAVQKPPAERGPKRPGSGPKSAAQDNRRDDRAGSGSVSASPATGDDAA